VIPLGATTFDPSRGVLVRGGVETALSTKESELLAWLAARPGVTVTRDELLAGVWGYAADSLSRTVDTTVRRLRAKLEDDPANPAMLLTVHGTGYRLEIPAAPIPADDDDFVGRKHELAALVAVAVPGALVSVVGPAGAGKTRLSQRFLASVPGVFVALAEARDEDAVVTAMAHGLGVPLTHGRAQLGHALAARAGAVLVLDNAEQAIDAIAAVVAELRRAAPRTAFVVTSREPLRLAGEAIVALEPLPADDAVTLLRRRAVPGWAGPGDADAVAEIAARLDGLPLAIELAAARTAVLGPRELLARLSDHLGLLARGRRDATDRQRTLRGALDWSWDLLDDRQKAAFARSSVFRGGFDLALFEAVGGELDALHDLVDRSLVQARRGDVTTFALFDTVRAYAEDRLRAAGGWDAAVQAHTDAILGAAEGLARRVNGPGGVAALDRLAALLADLRAVHARSVGRDALAVVRAALAIDPVLAVRGPVQGHLAILDAAVAAGADPAVPAAANAALLRARADVRRQIGGLADALADLDAAAGLAIPFSAAASSDPASGAPSLGNPPGGRISGAPPHTSAVAAASGDQALRALILATRAPILLELGRHADAEAACAQARELGIAAGSRRAEGLAAGFMGLVHSWRGAYAEAERALLDARAIWREIGDRASEVNVLINLGNIVLGLGRSQEAAAYLRAAVEASREVHSRRREAIALVNLASLAFAEGDGAAAEAAVVAALTIHREVGQRREAAITLGNLAYVRYEIGKVEQARRDLQEAIDLYREVGHVRGEAIALGNLGMFLHREGDLAGAVRWYDDAVDKLRAVGDGRALAHSLSWRGAAHAERGELTAAEADFDEAIRSLGTGGDAFVRAVVAVNRGHLDVARGDLAAAKAGIAAAADDAPRSAEIRGAIAFLEGKLRSR
jgi:predicted ATPase/DNA-binding winged helix-turn-helix (wHTH) protein